MEREHFSRPLDVVYMTQVLCHILVLFFWSGSVLIFSRSLEFSPPYIFFEYARRPYTVHVYWIVPYVSYTKIYVTHPSVSFVDRKTKEDKKNSCRLQLTHLQTTRHRQTHIHGWWMESTED